MPQKKIEFPGFPTAGIKFLKDLKNHNDRDWFNARKQIFEEQVREPMLALIAAVHGRMLKFAPEYVGDPKKSIYRIYRDTRFSKNKTPYKTHMASLFWRNGLGKDDGAGFFFMISPEAIEIAGGVYAPMPDQLLAVRKHVAENPAEFKKTFKRASVVKLLGELQGESVSRMPKGFSPDHAEGELIRKKQFILATSLDGSIAATPQVLPEIVSRLEAMTPFIEFLNAPLIMLKESERAAEAFQA